MFCCLEHIELALDIAVDEHETAPIMEKVKEAVSCGFCEKQAVYVVGN
jgi:CxxH/CxxC protein (TIGR04129 family)